MSTTLRTKLCGALLALSEHRYSNMTDSVGKAQLWCLCCLLVTTDQTELYFRAGSESLQFKTVIRLLWHRVTMFSHLKDLSSGARGPLQHGLRRGCGGR